MAVDRVPVLKRCRSLGLDPVYLGRPEPDDPPGEKTG